MLEVVELHEEVPERLGIEQRVCYDEAAFVELVNLDHGGFGAFLLLGYLLLLDCLDEGFVLVGFLAFGVGMRFCSFVLVGQFLDFGLALGCGCGSPRRERLGVSARCGEGAQRQGERACDRQRAYGECGPGDREAVVRCVWIAVIVVGEFSVRHNARLDAHRRSLASFGMLRL